MPLCTIKVDVHIHSPAVGELVAKIDEFIAVVKDRQVDAAQVAELTRRLDEQSEQLKHAVDESSS